MQTISAISSNVAVRGDGSPCSRGLWLEHYDNAISEKDDAIFAFFITTSSTRSEK